MVVILLSFSAIHCPYGFAYFFAKKICRNLVWHDSMIKYLYYLPRIEVVYLDHVCHVYPGFQGIHEKLNRSMVK